MMRVSVILPSLNVAGYIGEAVESVRHQTLSNIEIICIDAGSTDGTWEIIESAASKDDRITAVQSPVKSYGYQVNTGLDMACGEYVGILETDDYVLDSMYEDLYRAASSKELDYMKCDYSTYLTENDGDIVLTERSVSTNPFFYDNVFAPVEHPETVIDDWYLWNGIYRTSFLRKNHIRFLETPGAAFQDIGFLHQVATAAKKARYLRKSLYRYCVDREGASSNSDQVLDYVRQEYGMLVNEVGYDSKRNDEALLYRRMARSYVSACRDLTDEVLYEKKSICDWFQRILSIAERQGYIREMDQPVSLRAAYRKLLVSMDDFIEYRAERGRELEQFLLNVHTIVIYGCGVYGREALDVIKKYGYKPAFFMDSDNRAWGTLIEDIEVIGPDRIIDLPSDTGFLVANERNADEIKNVIRRYSHEAKIFEFTSELIYTQEYKKRRK